MTDGIDERLAKYTGNYGISGFFIYSKKDFVFIGKISSPLSQKSNITIK